MNGLCSPNGEVVRAVATRARALAVVMAELPAAWAGHRRHGGTPVGAQ
jgi:hypothetical protein